MCKCILTDKEKRDVYKRQIQAYIVYTNQNSQLFIYEEILLDKLKDGMVFGMLGQVQVYGLWYT